MILIWDEAGTLKCDSGLSTADVRQRLMLAEGLVSNKDPPMKYNTDHAEPLNEAKCHHTPLVLQHAAIACTNGTVELASATCISKEKNESYINH